MHERTMPFDTTMHVPEENTKGERDQPLTSAREGRTLNEAREREKGYVCTKRKRGNERRGFERV